MQTTLRNGPIGIWEWKLEHQKMIICFEKHLKEAIQTKAKS